MRIDTNINYVNNIPKSGMNYKNIKKVDLDNKQENNKKRHHASPKLINEDVQHYSKIYNQASINYGLLNKNIEEKTDAEINLEVDRRIYDRNGLKEDGIEFNSPEFRSWLQRNKDGMVIPLDAPAKIRKKIANMLDSIPDDNVGVKFDVAEAISKMFSGNDGGGAANIINNCDKVISENSEYIKLVKLYVFDSKETRDNIDTTRQIIDIFRDFKSFIKLNYE